MSHTPLERVFVYGTLKRGFCNHALLARARFVDTAVTVERFGLYLGPDVYAPGQVDIPFLYRIAEPLEDAVSVHGEVWAVDAATLKRLDHLEGHPDWYRRETILVTTATEELMNVQAYLIPGKPSTDLQPITTGCY